MSNDSRDNVQIPVIDISNADHTTGHELVEAVAKYGFVFIRAHGTDFTSDLVDGMFGLVSDKPKSCKSSLISYQLRHVTSSSLHTKRRQRVPSPPTYVFFPPGLLKCVTMVLTVSW